jgi:multidrug efflux pump subunit AcrB
MEASDRLRGIAWSFVVAACLSYMVMAALTESFGVPIAVLSALVPSLAVPALVVLASRVQLDSSIACSFVAVSGMAVNASVLTVDEWRLGTRRRADSAYELYALVRARVGSLAATCGTSVAGAVPFLFLREEAGSLVKSLALVAAAGTGASFFVAVVVVPALVKAAPGLFSAFPLSDSRSYERKAP